MARKGENIRKRKDGRWEARYMKGRRPDGRIQYGYVYADKYTDVKRKRQEALLHLEAIAQPVGSEPPAVLFRDFIPKWQEMVHSSIKYSSLCFYRTLLERHLCPYFGNMYLDSINSETVQHFINQKATENYSTAYIHSMITLLQSILRTAGRQTGQRTAFETGHLYVQMPAKKQPTFRTFSFAQWQILTAYLLQRQDTFSLGLLLCMHTGIRIGELSGLQWGDFDAETGLLHVQRTVSRVRNLNEAIVASPRTRLHIGPPKTPSSVRNIPLPSSLHTVLQLQKEQKLPKPEHFILTGTSRCMEPRTIQKRFRRLLEECQLPYLNFHALRHTWHPERHRLQEPFRNIGAFFCKYYPEYLCPQRPRTQTPVHRIIMVIKMVSRHAVPKRSSLPGGSFLIAAKGQDLRIYSRACAESYYPVAGCFCKKLYYFNKPLSNKTISLSNQSERNMIIHYLSCKKHYESLPGRFIWRSSHTFIYAEAVLAG